MVLKTRVSKVTNFNVILNGDVLTRVPYYKYLGVSLDSALNFNKHVDNCRKVVSHKLYILSRIRKHIDEETSTRIFKSMIAPLIDYGDIIYAGTNQINLDKLQSLQVEVSESVWMKIIICLWYCCIRTV